MLISHDDGLITKKMVYDIISKGKQRGEKVSNVHDPEGTSGKTWVQTLLSRFSINGGHSLHDSKGGHSSPFISK